MPELPEVETIRGDLAKQIVNKKIKEITIKKPKLVKNSNYKFKNTLEESFFSDIERIGKLLIFVIKSKIKKEEKKFLLVHLKMTGQLIYCDKQNFIAGGHINSKKEEEEFLKKDKNDFCSPGKYTHIIFKFQGNSFLFFNDLRQFGYLKIVGQKELNKIKLGFGIEPGQINFIWNNFNKIFKNRKTNVKALLLNQKIISGLGNIYVDESLFVAKIKPTRESDSLSENEKKKLFKAIKEIIREAIKYRGTTFSDYVDSNGKQGGFKSKLKVYGKDGEECSRCQGSIIIKSKVAGRGTRHCPNCQK